jgi:hypothetical protein
MTTFSHPHMTEGTQAKGPNTMQSPLNKDLNHIHERGCVRDYVSALILEGMQTFKTSQTTFSSKSLFVSEDSYSMIENCQGCGV